MEFKTIWTLLGLAKRANAEVLGSLVEITHMAFGDADGDDAFLPDQAMEALVNEVHRQAVDFVQIDEEQPQWVNVEGHILAADGGWWVREIGLFDADGDLVAVGNCAPRYKPVLEEGESGDQYFRLVLLTSNTAVITLKTNTALAVASRKYVDDNTVACRSSHMRVVLESQAVLAGDRALSIDASAGDIDLTLFAANSVSARAILLHREDDTANTVNVLVVAGTVCRMDDFPEILTGQDETVSLFPRAATNNWIKVI